MLRMRYGFEIDSVMTDNGAEFGSGKFAKNKEEHPFERLLTEMEMKHRYIQNHTGRRQMGKFNDYGGHVRKNF